MAVTAATAMLLLPVLIFRYLPSVDLPQHLAVTSMLLDGDGSAFGEFYEPALLRTLYWLPYGLWMALSRIGSLDISMRLVLLASMGIYPLAVAVLLRTLRKPVHYALLALPLVYNQAFFWGFVNFSLAIGMGLLAWALILRRRPGPRGDLWLALLSAATVLTHGYGVGMIVGFAAMLLLFDRRIDTLRRVLPVLPAVLGIAVWTRLAESAPLQIQPVFDSPLARLGSLRWAVLGGYSSEVESLLLLVWLGVFCWFSRRRLVTLGGWRALTPVERAIAAFALCNFIFYLFVPNSFAAVQQIAFRHALIGALVMPLLLPTAPKRQLLRRARPALALLVAATIVVAWVQCARFNAEARDFDALQERIPSRPRLAAVIHDGRGSLMRMPVYWHFGGYIQAERGGFLECSFPELFWNIPVRLRSDQPLLESRMGCVKPALFDTRRLPAWTDTVITRGGSSSEPARFREAAFELELERSPWRLYRRSAPGSDGDQSDPDDIVVPADGLQQLGGNRAVEADDRHRIAS